MSYLPRVAEEFSNAVLNQAERAFYARHILLPGIGLDGQRRLKSARVLVVGAGGLGCPVLQALAGAGVGTLDVIDGDQVALSNLSRQWLHRVEDVGSNKAVSACASVQQLNPFIQVSATAEFLNSGNADQLIASCDLVIDATDDLDVRYLIDSVCARNDRPWVHAALYREAAQLTVFWEQVGSSFRKLYPEPSSAPSCAGAGMLGASASLVGNLQALEAIKLITGNGRPCVGRLLSVDSRGLVLRTFDMPGVAALEPIPTSSGDSTSEWSLSLDAFAQAQSIHQPMTVIDIRIRSEFEQAHIEGALHVPDSQILEDGLPDDVSGVVVLVCEVGVISAMLAEALCNEYEDLRFLAGGFQAWQAHSAMGLC